MARKVIIEEPNGVPSLTLLGIAALILALGVAFYFERQAKREPVVAKANVSSDRSAAGIVDVRPIAL